MAAPKIHLKRLILEPDRYIGWDQECSAVARYDIVLNLPMSDTGAY